MLGGVKIAIWLAALMHFCVDALCLCCLCITTNNPSCYFIYNVMAFLTQPITGLLADKVSSKYSILYVSMLMFALSACFAAIPSCNVVVVAILLGLGNSLFHVWGGRGVAVATQNDIRALGIFVSPGVLGLAIGAIFASWYLYYILLMLLGILSTIHSCCTNFVEQQSASDTNKKPYVFLIIVVLIAFVVLRSFGAGEFSTTLEKDGGIMILISAIVAALGKGLGGYFARVSKKYFLTFFVFSIVTLICFLVGNILYSTVYIGLFAVNCTMPFTLYWAQKLFPKKEGFAFGLLAAALMPPYIITYIVAL
jgi:FSR family fosmidomycin resistance protein-like MFS transporter